MNTKNDKFTSSKERRFTFARIDISYARFFFLRKRGKSTIICAFKIAGFLITFICHMDRLDIL